VRRASWAIAAMKGSNRAGFIYSCRLGIANCRLALWFYICTSANARSRSI
jgi:hypothetical protein